MLCSRLIYMPDYRAYIINGRFDSIRTEFLHLMMPPPLKRPNNSLTATTLSFGTVTDSWAGTSGNEVRPPRMPKQRRAKMVGEVMG